MSVFESVRGNKPAALAEPSQAALPVYQWLGIEKPAPTPEISAGSFSVLPMDPDEYEAKFLQDPVDSESVPLSSQPEQPIRTLPEIYDGQPLAEVPITEISDADIEIDQTPEFMTEPETVEDTDQEMVPSNVGRGKFVFRSLLRSLPSAKEARQGIMRARETVATAFTEHKKETLVAAGATIGALVVGALVHKYMPDLATTHAHEAAHSSQPETATPQNTAGLIAPLVKLHLQSHPVVEHTAKALHKAKFFNDSLKFYGDTISYHVRADLAHKLGHVPSAGLLRKVTGRELKLNHMSWADAKHMFNHQNFKVFSWLRQK